ncbi:protein phosphatase [Lithospermum erythrorhizon]|uniref:Protein phosphatase n=1 Tax=Lithospermum erythrorhizon TaxID=34254 RepID=A0AAV3R4J2_LITER
MTRCNFACQHAHPSYLSHPVTDKASHDGETDWLRFGYSSMQGISIRMEDALAAYPDLDSSTAFFGVYDGHLGNEVAVFCAKYLHQELVKQEDYLAGDLSTALQKAFLRMDEMICEKIGQREDEKVEGEEEQASDKESPISSPKKKKAKIERGNDDRSSDHGSASDIPISGSFACVAIIRHNQLIVANVGDSRCVLSRQGRAYPISKYHKITQDSEIQRITEAGGYVGSVKRPRAIGDLYFKTDKSLPAEKQIVTANPDIESVDLNIDDEFLILASYRIWEWLSGQEVVDLVREQLNSENRPKLSTICETLIDKLHTGGNVTVMLVQLKELPR